MLGLDDERASSAPFSHATARRLGPRRAASGVMDCSGHREPDPHARFCAQLAFPARDRLISSFAAEYKHFGEFFDLIDRRFAIHPPSTGRRSSGGGGRFGAMACAARIVFSHVNDSTLNSSNAIRAAHAVAPNLAHPPEERLATTDIKPLARSKCRRRRRGAPPCRRHARGGGHFPVLLPVRTRNSLWSGSTKHFRVSGCMANRRSIISRNSPKWLYSTAKLEMSRSRAGLQYARKISREVSVTVTAAVNIPRSRSSLPESPRRRVRNRR